MEYLSSESSQIRDGRLLAGLALAGVVVGGLGLALHAADSGLDSYPTSRTPILTQVSAPFRQGVYIGAEAAGVILVSGAAIAYAIGRRQEDSE